MEKSDKIMLAMVQDKMDQCNDYGRQTHTGFLDDRQRILAENTCKKIKGLCYEFYGGYEEAERRVFIAMPDLEMGENPLAVLRITSVGTRELSHRDYMGSILGLGVKRELVGDILVTKTGADIVILKEMADFFVSNYDKAGATPIKVEIVETEEILAGEQDFEEIRETMPSLRLDNMIASAFKVPRSKAAEAITSGLVYINGQQSTKLDKTLIQGDKVVLRGKGKILLHQVLANNKKDKKVVVLKKYK